MFKKSKLFIFSIATTTLISLSIAASAKVIVKEKYSYYDISGKTGAQLHKSMVRNGSKRVNIKHTLAATKPRLKIKNVKAGVVGRNCVIKNVDVNLTLTYILPRWNGKKNADKSVVKSWNKFNKLLIRHEKKHGKIAVDAVNSLYKELRRLKGKTSKKCRDFGRNAEWRLNRIGKTLAARQRAFDRREAYGLSAVRRAERKFITSK